MDTDDVEAFDTLKGILNAYKVGTKLKDDSDLCKVLFSCVASSHKVIILIIA